MLEFRFNNDFANNWKKGQIVEVVDCPDDPEYYLVDRVAKIPKHSLSLQGEFLEDTVNSFESSKELVSLESYLQFVDVWQHEKFEALHSKILVVYKTDGYEKAHTLLMNYFQHEFSYGDAIVDRRRIVVEKILNADFHDHDSFSEQEWIACCKEWHAVASNPILYIESKVSKDIKDWLINYRASQSQLANEDKKV